MKIGKINIHNFRSIQETEFDLQDTVTALAGGNESGKSNALKAVKKFLDRSTFEEADQYQLSDLPPTITITFNCFTESEKAIIVDLFNDQQVSELTIKRTGEQYELVNPLPPELPEIIAPTSPDITTKDEGEAEIEKKLDNEVEPVPSAEPEPLSPDEIKDSVLELLPKVEYIRAINELIIGKNISIIELYDAKNTNGELNTVRKFLELGGITEDIVKSIDTDSKVKHLNRSAANIGKKLRDSWNQEDIKLRIFADNEKLVIHFRDGKNLAKKDKEDDTKWIWTLPEDRSDGFRWYVTFYTRYIAKLQESSNIILLLDDAGGPLNKIAQEDLVREIEKLCKDNNDLQVFYVTHSKDMLNWSERERILLAEKKNGSGTKIEKCWWEKYSKRNLPGPLSELGASWESDFLLDSNLLVEGYTDQMILQRLQTIFSVIDGFPQQLFIANKLVVSSGTTEMIDIGKLAKALKKKIFLLTDSDSPGLKIKEEADEFSINSGDLKSLTANQSVFTIEDLLPKKELIEALNTIGKNHYPDDWEEIKQLRKTTKGVESSLKTRVDKLGLGSKIWKKLKLEVVSEVVDKLSLGIFDKNPETKAAVISLFTNLKKNLD